VAWILFGVLSGVVGAAGAATGGGFVVAILGPIL
jgi:hypothetical protein